MLLTVRLRLLLQLDVQLGILHGDVLLQVRSSRIPHLEFDCEDVLPHNHDNTGVQQRLLLEDVLPTPTLAAMQLAFSFLRY